ncbi:AraC family transcriptional regulator [Myxococcus landrumensis]|uniref:AraC family transcriptional regulator n=1 Tax=Myxococcus landrumensis TaxID=2813577 RepID=A0ABX7NFB7_9BACT|nr:AraC family transcriptional regulator [Myxococcus landrumus]QSQ17537.1 AraC family transcriptional regulator [Myxococcus landrumus]
MTQRFRVAYTLPRRLAEMGISPEAVLQRAGLPLGLFDLEKILVTTDELFALYRGMTESSEDPAIGLKLGTENRVEQYDPVAIAGLYARSFRDAIERIARYKQLICPEELRLHERGDESEVRFVWTFSDEREPPLLVDHCFSWLVGIGRKGTERPLNPRRVEFQRATEHKPMYEAHFGCPVKFKASHDSLVFHRADLDLPFVSHNPDMLGVIAPQLELELGKRLAQSSLSERARSVLKRQLAGQRPAIQQVASELCVSTRTLQRRLNEEGFSFQSLLEEARRELARHYLAHSPLELSEIAYLLGYEDANSFFRAFHHWEGVPPGQWRVVQARA